MMNSSGKASNNFLSLFSMHIYKAGKVITTESGSPSPIALILINGDVMSYKRLIDFTSSKFEEKDEERQLLLQN